MAYKDLKAVQNVEPDHLESLILSVGWWGIPKILKGFVAKFLLSMDLPRFLRITYKFI